jgi:GNAT superfamily N-acetyltransferase
MEGPPGCGRVGSQLSCIGEKVCDMLTAPDAIFVKPGFRGRGYAGQALRLFAEGFAHLVRIGASDGRRLVGSTKKIGARHRPSRESAHDAGADQPGADRGGESAYHDRNSGGSASGLPPAIACQW